ncbi:MAG: dihydrodipicolinate synthase family protein [Methylococcaceae bacterium]|nr:dihydrodipicolinate synthase family protein [Methylococcaceae bacterium]
MTEPLRGLWCATLTPLNRAGGIDFARFAGHARNLLARGVDGIVPFGTSGEGPSFSVAERNAALDSLLAAGVAPERMAPAIGCTALSDTVALAGHALRSGCPRCLVVPPLFWKDVSEEAVFRYYAALIEAVADDRLRIYLYHIPQVSAVPISVETVARLAEAFPGVIAGVKDSAAEFAHTAALVKRLPRLAILTGFEPHLPELMQIGCAGTICGLANLWPERIAELMRPDASPEEVSQVRAALSILHRQGFVPSLKAVLARRSGNPDWCRVRPPLMAVADEGREELLSSLARAGF